MTIGDTESGGQPPCTQLKNIIKAVVTEGRFFCYKQKSRLSLYITDVFD